MTGSASGAEPHRHWCSSARLVGLNRTIGWGSAARILTEQGHPSVPAKGSHVGPLLLCCASKVLLRGGPCRERVRHRIACCHHSYDVSRNPPDAPALPGQQDHARKYQS